MCSAFVADANGTGAQIAKDFSFKQTKTQCKEMGVPKAFRPSAIFLDARIIRTAAVSRTEHRLAVQVPAGWVLTTVAWNVSDSENATPPWTTEEPEAFVADGGRLIAYQGGADWAHNEALSSDEDGGRRNSTARYLRGAVVCELGATTLRCLEWNPTERQPLGLKEGAAGFKNWGALPWRNLRTLSVPDAGLPRVVVP